MEKKYSPKEIEVAPKPPEFKFDFDKFGKDFFDALFEIGDFKVGTAVKKILKHANLEEQLEQKVYVLIFTSLFEAYNSLSKEYHLEQLNKSQNLVIEGMDLKVNISSQIKESKFKIDKSFFEHPHTASFLKFFKGVFLNWLESIGISKEDSQNTASRLPWQFGIEIRNEAGKEKYAPLLNYFDIRLASEEYFHSIADYYNSLIEEYYSPTLGDSKISLSDIYIEPDFKIYKKCFQKEAGFSFDKEGFANVDYGKSIHHYLENHFLQNNPAFGLEAENSRLLILLGQPGQGKTSFCIRACNGILNSTSHCGDLIFFRLRNLINVSDFIDHPIEELTNNFNDFNWPLNNTILILDGLDELYMGQGLSNHQIDHLLFKISQVIKQNEGLFVIVTSRYNFINLDNIGRKEALVLNLSGFDLEKQLNWLDKYRRVHPECQLTPRLIREINLVSDEEKNKYKHLRELINQPILLNLIARVEFNITNTNNRSAIYNHLFKTLIERSWDDGQLKKYQNLEEREEGMKDLRDYLGAVALIIFQSDYEYITREELLGMDATKRFVENYIGNRYEKIEDALKDILVSFYFKSIERFENNRFQKEKQARAIEFYHKSLQEFLAAEKIWNTVVYKFTEKNVEGKYVVDNWETALEILSRLASPKPLSEDVTNYLIEIINNSREKELKPELEARLLLFFPDLLKHQFLFQYSAKSNRANPFRMACSCFYAFWTILSHLNLETNQIDDSYSTELCVFIKTTGTYLFRPYYDLSNETLRGVNLSGADLRGANLLKADLQEAVMWGTDLRAANLARTNLKGTYFWRAHLSEANFNGSDLFEAVLPEADLSKAFLGGTNLQKANLDRANLEQSVMIGSNLNEASLRKANFSNTDLTGAELINANLKSSFLQGALLREANLTNANLQKADLSSTDFSGATLIGANFERACLENANFEDAIGISVDQLSKAFSLKGCKGLTKDTESELRNKYPFLFLN